MDTAPAARHAILGAAFALASLLCPGSAEPAAAEDAADVDATAYGSEERYDAGARYGASMGSVTVGDRQFYRLSMRPDIPVGPLGVALDIELFIDDSGNFSDRGWAFGTSTEILDTFLRKIYYVRYGQPRDPVYVRLGALDNVTLGYGALVNGYRNTVQYPGIKKTGVQFQVEGVGGSRFDVEGLVNNLQDLKEGGALIGLRVASRAAGKLEVGVSYVVDLDQYAGLLDRDGDGYPDEVDAFPDDGQLALDNDGDGVPDGLDSDDDNNGAIDADDGSGLPAAVRADLLNLEATYGPAVFPVDRSVSRRVPFNKDSVGRDWFSIVGLDAGYPLMASQGLKLTLYGQLAAMVDDDDKLADAAADSQGVSRGNHRAKGFGIMAPGLWLRTGPFEGRLEYRFFQDDFEAGYFDNLYELDRARVSAATGKATAKDASLRRGESVNGIYGRLAADLYGLVDAAGDYQHLVGADTPRRQLHAAARLAPRLLQSVPRLSRARAYYQKNNIGARLDEKGTPGSEDGFFESTEDTFYGYELGLQMASGVAVVWDTRFYFERGADGSLARRKVMGIETVFDF
ncbi:MAG: hypothetical protein ABIL09_28800 [Gemmatimonadota bacterium]